MNAFLHSVTIWLAGQTKPKGGFMFAVRKGEIEQLVEMTMSRLVMI